MSKTVDNPSAAAEELPLWGKAVVLLLFWGAATFAGSWVLARILDRYFERQQEHVNWCVKEGGSVSVGSFGGVTCHGLWKR